MELSEIDEKLAIAGNRSSFFTPEQGRELLGDEWADANPASLDTYSTGDIINALLDLRLEHMEANEITEEVTQDGEAIQEELDALLGTDINVS